jgi:hypothetical protein
MLSQFSGRTRYESKLHDVVHMHVVRSNVSAIKLEIKLTHHLPMYPEECMLQSRWEVIPVSVRLGATSSTAALCHPICIALEICFESVAKLPLAIFYSVTV